jgi:tetratricopeptide (TPR) repeat protein
MALGEADTTTRQRRQLADSAIAHATHGEWEAAVEANRSLLELGPDIDASNRLGKALAELGRHAEALEAYEQALERDATNRIAQRNVERLRVLLAAEKPGKNGKNRTGKAPATVFIEEMGKTGRARLVNLSAPRALAPLSPGDAVDLAVEGDQLIARVGDAVIGSVEPRIATRLLKLIADGNRYDHPRGRVGPDDHHPRGLHPSGEFRKGLVPHARSEHRWRQTVHEGLRASLR